MTNILMLINEISCGPSFLSYHLFFHHSFPLFSFHCYFIDPYTHLPPPPLPHIHQYTRPSLHPHSSFIPSLLIPSLFHCSNISPFHPSINLPFHPSTFHPFSFPLSHSNSTCRPLGRRVSRRSETLLNEN